MPEALGASPYAAGVDGLGVIADTDLHVCIDLPGRLELPRLRAALVATAAGVPELAGRLERRWWRYRWQLDPQPDWDLREHHRVDSQQARELELRLFDLPFEPTTALPIRLWLLHMEDGDRLLLRISHLLADGGGSKNLCYRVAEAYRRLDAEPGWRPQPQRLPHPVRRLLRCLRWRQLPALLLGWLDELWDNRPMRPLFVPMGSDTSGQKRFELLHLSAERVSRLRARWSPQGVTLNDLALAAFTRAVQASFPEPNSQRSHAVLVVTGDLRKHEQPQLDVCNFSAIRPLELGSLPLGEPVDHLQQLARTTARWKRGGAGLMGFSVGIIGLSLLPHALIRGFFTTALRAIRATQKGTAALTNIGPIQAELLDFGRGPCRAAWVAAPVAHPPMMITALTGCAGALDFTVAYQTPALAPEQARRLLAAFDRELDALA